MNLFPRSVQKNIDVILNQASTGYVSGISYRYQGMVIQGSKLGNAFKWSSIEDTINYEQERDKPIIHVWLQRYKKIADKESNTDLLIYPSTFTGKAFGAAVEDSKRTIQQAIDCAVDKVLKMPKLLPLKTLLDSNTGDEPDMIDRELKKEQQRKKRRGLRR